MNLSSEAIETIRKKFLDAPKEIPDEVKRESAYQIILMLRDYLPPYETNIFTIPQFAIMAPFSQKAWGLGKISFRLNRETGYWEINEGEVKNENNQDRPD
jgi:hypothetical protein